MGLDTIYLSQYLHIRVILLTPLYFCRQFPSTDIPFIKKKKKKVREKHISVLSSIAGRLYDFSLMLVIRFLIINDNNDGHFYGV